MKEFYDLNIHEYRKSISEFKKTGYGKHIKDFVNTAYTTAILCVLIGFFMGSSSDIGDLMLTIGMYFIGIALILYMLFCKEVRKYYMYKNSDAKK